MIEMLVNRCRSFIFTTALAPASAAAARVALEVLRSHEGQERLDRLRRYAARLYPGQALASPIVPFVIGGEQAAVDASVALRHMGLLVPAVRPPTVPTGTSRLRVALSAAHTDAEVAGLATALGELGLVAGPVREPGARRRNGRR